MMANAAARSTPGYYASTASTTTTTTSAATPFGGTPGPTSERETPSTAAVARRLDRSYGPPVSEQPPTNSQTKPDLSQFKRTSEIFPRSTIVGNDTPPVAARTRSSEARVAAIPSVDKVEESPQPNKNTTSSSSPQVQPSRSPFGGARATLVPALPVGSKDHLIPPLVLEPAVKPFDMRGDSRQKDGPTKKEKKEEKKDDSTAVVGTVNGDLTPVHSNALSTEATLLKANQVLMEVQIKQNGVTDISSSSSNVTLSQPTHHSRKEKEAQPPKRSKSTSSLMDQLNKVVALKGEKAVIGLLEKLEKHTTASFNSPLTPRGRSMDLLSSMVGAPLTPRSRPTSPERWNNPPLETKKNRVAPLPKGEKMDQTYILEAANILPNEYETDLVNYTVRNPNSSESFDYDFFSSEESYREKFDIDESDSVEVLARIEADGSVFALIGNHARHGKTSSESGFGEEEALEWNVFEDIDETSRVLGSVTYIDMEGNEKEYWLDSIYEEALFIRESYCTSIRSAACALQHAAKSKGAVGTDAASIQNNPQSHEFLQPGSNQPSGSAPIHGGGSHDPHITMSNQFVQKSPHPSLDTRPNPIQSDSNHAPPTISTETEEVVPEPARVDLPKHPSPMTQHAEEKSTVGPSTEPSEKVPKSSSSIDKKEPKQQPQEYELADSALPVMIVSLFSLFFSIVWFFCIKMPYRICSTVLTFCVILISCRVLWLLLADDNGAWEIGAGVEYEYNSPGIY
eukprot:CCRYP_018149-RA/>CCRYP_018149-RA protein AED:0.33 eAED:0.33 QI:289/1/1/1/1/1/3/326/738